MSAQETDGTGLLRILDDEAPVDPAAPAPAWRVLVVDDDDGVHETTQFALDGAIVLGRPIELLHARSAAEARDCMAEHDDVALALVDVVMESPDAGLQLVRHLRQAGYDALRIVLRTGQPGYAPEQSVISAYEIDDYRTKAELTQTRLLTVITVAIRAYDQIRTIARSRAGLEMIVDSSTKLFSRTNLKLFSSGVLTQIAGLLGVEPNGLVCVVKSRDGDEPVGQIISATGRFTPLIGGSTTDIAEPEIRQLLQDARGKTAPLFRHGYVALHFHCPKQRDLSALVMIGHPLTPQDLALLKLFSTNIAIGFDNLSLVESLDRLAYLDPVLEDVPNLNAFEDALTARLTTDRAGGRMALVNVDSFQWIVASNGIRAAHQFLNMVYAALSISADGRLFVARIADATFALLGDRGAIDDKLVPAVFAEPFQVGSAQIATTATTALLDLPDLDGDAHAILRTAGSALLHIKQTQRGKAVTYDASMRERGARHYRLQTALRSAVEHCDGLAVHLQPKCDLAVGTVVGAEALVRWTHHGEAIGPGEFIPIAEAAGLMPRLTEFVIESVGLRAATVGAKALGPVAVNLSMVELNMPGFAERLLRIVRNANLSPDTIDFEVTEGIAMRDKPWAVQQLQALRDEGFRIALDDFGTGYSSLGNFDKLPIDTLKIDRSFVTRLDVHTARHSLAAVVLAMTQTLEVDCVAEGIETEAQKQALAFLGCKVGQGYLLGRPTAIGDFDRAFAPAGSA